MSIAIHPFIKSLTARGKPPLRIPLLLSLLALGAVFCSFVPSSQPSGGAPGGPSGTEELAALQRADAALAGLAGADGTIDRAALLTHLRKDSAFADSGASPDGSIWARFPNGRLAIFAGEDPILAGDSPASASGAAPSPSGAVHASLASFPIPAPRPDSPPAASGAGADFELPESDSAVMMDSLAGGYGQYGNDINGWLNKNGYDSHIVDPSVDNLLAVKGVGVFYFGTHGGLGCVGSRSSCLRGLSPADEGGDPFQDWVYALWTSTPVTKANDALYAADLNAGKLAYFKARRIPRDEGGVPEWHYAITAKFIREEMSFSADSIVMLDGCGSFEGDLKFAFADAGAALFLGWTERVDPGQSTRYFFDRMLGINEITPSPLPKPDPPNRPFDAESVFATMVNYGINIQIGGVLDLLDEGDGGEFRPTQVPYTPVLLMERLGGSPGILLPTIKSLTIDEEEETLTLEGVFGKKKGEVTIGENYSAQINSWSPEKIEVKLPAADKSGGYGGVVVKVDEHKSNAVPLTRWYVKFHYKEGPEQTVSATQELYMDVYWRADLHVRRTQPDGEPEGFEPVPLIPAKGSTARWECDWNARYGEITFTTDVGEGELELTRDPAAIGFSSEGTLDWPARKILVGFSVNVDQDTTCVVTTSGGGVSFQSGLGFVLLPSILENYAPGMPILAPLKIDGEYVIKGENRDLNGDGQWPWLKWDDAKPESPPKKGETKG